MLYLYCHGDPHPASSGGISTPKSPRATITPSDSSRMPAHHNAWSKDGSNMMQWLGNHMQMYSEWQKAQLIARNVTDTYWYRFRQHRFLWDLSTTHTCSSLSWVTTPLAGQGHAWRPYKPSHAAAILALLLYLNNLIFFWQLARGRVLSPSTPPVPVMSSTADGFSIFASNLILMDTWTLKNDKTYSSNIRGRS